MELGATVCTPTSSSCSKCPVSLQCHALSLSQQGGSTLVTDFPQKAVKVKQRNEYSAVCVVEISESRDLLEGVPANSKYLLVKRPDEGLLAGLWEFPSVLLGQEAELSFRRKVIDDFLKKTFNLDSKKTCKVISRDDVGDYLHIFSHIRLKMYVELLVIHIKGLCPVFTYLGLSSPSICFYHNVLMGINLVVFANIPLGRRWFGSSAECPT